MSSRKIAGIAAASGGAAVALGALGAHAIKQRVTPEYLDIWNTAAHYHLVMSVALLAISLWDTESTLKVIQRLWMAGILIFSGTLYVLVLTGIRWLGAITPIGGVCLILGWVLLAAKLLKQQAPGAV
ncbi:MAG TPA: DUF423 domain-containing protein [Fimbriimonas sp.]|nr:DUF423 domain-containing protein [Fimbriimonas sp.]